MACDSTRDNRPHGHVFNCYYRFFIMAGFKLVDRYIPGDAINPQTRKLYVPNATRDIAIGDCVQYLGTVAGTNFDPENGRHVDSYATGIINSAAEVQVLAGIVVGLTDIETPLSNANGISAGGSGFLIVNTGFNLVYSGPVTGTISGSFTTNIVGSNIGVTVDPTTTSEGFFTSGQSFAGASITAATTVPFRIEWADSGDPQLVTLIHARLMLAEINSSAGITPS